MIDISEAKRTEQAQRLSEEKFELVFQQLPGHPGHRPPQSTACCWTVNRAFERTDWASAPTKRSARRPANWASGACQASARLLLDRLQQETLNNLEMPFNRRNGRSVHRPDLGQHIELDGHAGAGRGRCATSPS